MKEKVRLLDINTICKILILLNCSITFVMKNVLQFANQFVHHFYMLSIAWKNCNAYLIAQTSLGKTDLYKGTLRILIFSWCIIYLNWKIHALVTCSEKLNLVKRFILQFHGRILHRERWPIISREFLLGKSFFLRKYRHLN